MNVANRAAPGKRAPGYVCARPKPPSEPPSTTRGAAVSTTPANDVDPVGALVARYHERSAGILRELLSDLRELQRAPSTASPRHVAAPVDLEPVDELTRARARQLLEQHGARRRTRGPR